MSDKRLTGRLIKYWDMLRKDRPMPLWEQFNSGAFADVWQQCCGWDVEEGRSGINVYTYTYVGEAVKEALGDDPTGQIFVGKFRHFSGARIVERIDEVVRNCYPVTDEGQFVNAQDKIVKFRSCMLPFGTKRRGVVQVVLGLSWRAF